MSNGIVRSLTAALSALDTRDKCKREIEVSKESVKKCRKVQTEFELRCSTVQFQVYTSFSATFDTRIERWNAAVRRERGKDRKTIGTLDSDRCW